ncbi:MAG: hypothetical protein C4293_10710 [Nitrospiraceae bacterium]
MLREREGKGKRGNGITTTNRFYDEIVSPEPARTQNCEAGQVVLFIQRAFLFQQNEEELHLRLSEACP